jgi:HEAT repeat protein
MLSYGFSIVVVMLATLSGNQSISGGHDGALPTLAERLRNYNIELTQSALVGALRNANPEVRYLAAQKLAEDKATETIPTMKEALASEKTPVARMNIAYALAQLDDPLGFDSLENNCKDRDGYAGIRTQSAGYLLSLNRESGVCLSAALDVLENGSNGYKMEAASLLPQFHNLSEDDSQRVFVGLVKALHDSYALVRLDAGRALVDLGDTRAIAHLQQAVASETEPDIRPQLEQDLRILLSKVPSVK